MKTFLIILFSSLVVSLFSQEIPIYYHDPALDSLNGNAANIDADVNGYFSTYGPWKRTVDDANLAFAFYGGGTNVPIDSTGTNFVTFSSPKSTFTMVSNSASTNESIIVSAIRNFNSVFNYSNTFDSLNTNNSLVSGVNNQARIYLNGTFIDLGYDSFFAYNSTFLGIAHSVSQIVVAIVYLIFFFEAVRFLTEKLKGMMNQRQVKGNDQEFFGTNAALPLGGAYAVAVTALIFTFISYFVTSTFVGQGFSGVVQTPSLLNTFSQSNPFWPIVTSFIPVGTIFVCFINYCVFRFLYAEPLVFIVHSVILFLIA